MSAKYDLGEYLAARDLIHVDYEERVSAATRTAKLSASGATWLPACLRKLRERRRVLRYFAKAYLIAREPSRTLVHPVDNDEGSATA